MGSVAVRAEGYEFCRWTRLCAGCCQAICCLVTCCTHATQPLALGLGISACVAFGLHEVWCHASILLGHSALLTVCYHRDAGILALV